MNEPAEIKNRFQGMVSVCSRSFFSVLAFFPLQRKSVAVDHQRGVQAPNRTKPLTGSDTVATASPLASVIVMDQPRPFWAPCNIKTPSPCVTL
jgi:hypothetical protein